ncbi:hypothetical protein EW145_g5576 [Phellinidium pouzarii]|uniref:TPR-like protein n=1 Tax=Phellinidium pouzarii TaxID=167371 RepID=A0A4V3XC40_9AGAM|nr:hypothetical protein EW145_g5576 [Phellinidium pouzarii]
MPSGPDSTLTEVIQGHLGGYDFGPEFVESASSGSESQSSGSDETESIAYEDSDEDGDTNDVEEDSLVETQIEGDFDRLIGDIRGTSDVASSSMLSKIWDRPLGDDAEEQFRADLRAASGVGKASKGRKGQGKGHRRRLGPALSHQIRALIGEGNTAYVDGNPQEAIRIMTEVIRIEPRAISAWNVLATCHRDLGEPLKALQLAIMGAHLRHDADEWHSLAQQSCDLNLRTQALYCLAKATRLDPSNVAAFWDRATLARDVGDLPAARNAYLALLKRSPHNLNVLTEVRHILVELGDFKLCASLYQNAFDYFTSVYPEGKVSPEASILDPLLTADSEGASENRPSSDDFTLMELLVLADLYNSLDWYERSIKTIRAGCRWLQGRAKQKYWDSCPDDREYDIEGSVREAEDERVGALVVKQGFHPLDINARHRLAISRLRVGDIDEGRMHAGIILSQNIVDYAPLFSEISDAYFERKLYAEARPIYEMLGADASTSSMHVLMRAAECRRNLGDIRDAAEVYEHIIVTDPTNNEAKMKLAEIYEVTSQPRKALELVYQVMDARRRKTGVAQTDPSQQTSSDPDALTLFAETKRAKSTARRSQATLSREQLVELEHKKEEEASAWYTLVKQTWNDMLKGEAEAENDWLIHAEKLVEMFRETRNLFPSRGARPFSGMIRPSRQKQSAEKSPETEEAEEENMASRLELELEHESQTKKISSAQRVEVYHFRGIHFSEWLALIMEYAFLLTRRDQFDAAEDMLRHLLLSLVYQRQGYQDTLRLTLATCAMRQRKYAIVLESCRKLILTYQFNNEPVRIFLAALASGLAQTDQVINTSFQKFLLREMRIGVAAVEGNVQWVNHVRRYALSSIVSEKQDAEEPEEAGADNTGGDSEQAREIFKEITAKPTKYNPVLPTLYGQSLIMAKSYQSAIFYLLHALDYFPNDPLICLTLAVTSLGRAMQRQSDNRNYLVTQAMGFMTKYRTIRGPTYDAPRADEIEYNFGRAFHQIGIVFNT